MSDPTNIIASETTRAFHEEAFVFDALALDYVLDTRYTERLVEGGVHAVHVTFAIEETWSDTLRKIEENLDKIDKNTLLQFCTSAAQLEQARADGRIGILMGFQGSSMVENDFSRLSLLCRLGLRVIQLTYTAANLYGDGCGELRNAGLSFLGREFISAVNELPLLLDLSHCGHATSLEAAQLAKAPVVTHANAFAVNPNDRNKKDELVRIIADKQGVVGLCCLPRPVHPHSPTLDHLIQHFLHYQNLVGTDHIGLGLDFIEGLQEAGEVLPQSRRWRTHRPDIFGSVEDFVSQPFPEGLRSIRQLPNLTQKLVDCGTPPEAIQNVLGKNWLRVCRRVFDTYES